ncbi:hybrid signal transduction protein dokA isoform X1 [Drosophila nasuta]|uniref:hybrid signal transduction protein dokA isoform X1 n=2 Tax=Drosophila nasuta TaxID=42062 RepID=UPI00295F0941|nr:hybrid signal transduction protein dokA isoform X1 [Drosophila nasuta]
MTTSTPSSSNSTTNSNKTNNTCSSGGNNNSNNNNIINSNNNDNNNRQSINNGDGGGNERATSVATFYNGSSPSATTATIGSTNRVMQADEDFNIRFVNLVRTHRCLYDKKVPEYRNRDNQEKAWALISKETRESVIHCKERWRNLRACLSRYIKQQSGSEPQHKPYYLTEHMAFLLPFLKSTRNSLEGNSSLATLFQFSQQHLQLHQQQHQQEHLYCNNNNTSINNNNNINNHVMNDSMEMKQSLSDNDDEETIDAFDPAIAATLGMHCTTSTTGDNAMTVPGSPAHSDTASANSLQNFIPDVQLAETGPDLIYNDTSSTPLHHQHQPPHSHHAMASHLQQQQQHPHFEPSSAKRIKTECDVTTSGSGAAFFGGLSVTEHTDMEFFRSILPDIAALTPQQRRKFKIGILELIDDVVERYPSHERYNSTLLNGSGGNSSTGGGSGGANGAAVGATGSTPTRQQRCSSGRDWRK